MKSIITDNANFDNYLASYIINSVNITINSKPQKTLINNKYKPIYVNEGYVDRVKKRVDYYIKLFLLKLG